MLGVHEVDQFDDFLVNILLSLGSGESVGNLSDDVLRHYLKLLIASELENILSHLWRHGWVHDIVDVTNRIHDDPIRRIQVLRIFDSLAKLFVDVLDVVKCSGGFHFKIDSDYLHIELDMLMIFPRIIINSYTGFGFVYQEIRFDSCIDRVRS